MKRLLTILPLLILPWPFMESQESFGGDWPQWRGPNRDGIAVGEEGLLSSWPERGPRLLWRSEGVGTGYSSLAVAGDKIYTMGDIDGKQYVIASSRKGEGIIWKKVVGEAHAVDNFKGPRSTPTIDANRVYGLSTDGLLTCLEASTGTLKWKRDLVSEFGGFVARGNDYDWRFSESPLVDNDRVVVCPGSPTALIVAFEKNTGEEVWRTRQADSGERGADGAAYSSIVISHACGVKQYVTLTGRGAVGVNAENGEHLWGYNRIANKTANVPTPIVSGSHVFVSTGYGTGGALLELVEEDQRIQANEVYFSRKADNHHGGMILHHDHVFLGKGSNTGMPICIELRSGDVKWGPIRNDGEGSAAVSMADGHLYLRYQNGLMVLIEASSEVYLEKGSFMIPDVVDYSWSHPVVAGKRLYLREQNQLFCYDLSQ